MLNLYEVLEVSEKASKEVIEKAYRVLAKKYHPDLQVENEKQAAESKMKQINEAYEILSDKEKRKNYDLALEQERQEQIMEKQRRDKEWQEQMQHSKQNNQRVSQPEIQYQKVEPRNDYIRKQQQEYQNKENLQNEMNRAYAQAYNQYLRSLRL